MFWKYLDIVAEAAHRIQEAKRNEIISDHNSPKPNHLSIMMQDKPPTFEDFQKNKDHQKRQYVEHFIRLQTHRNPQNVPCEQKKTILLIQPNAKIKFSALQRI